MSRSRKASVGATATADVEAVLDTMSADELREVVGDLMLELDDRAHGRFVRSIFRRAAHGDSGWEPAPVSDGQVEEAVAFAEAARRAGRADPSDVDGYLHVGSCAFMRKDYATAHRILGALLLPIGYGEVDLGQHELVDEVLAADTSGCAAQYVVSAYMITPPAGRAERVRAAIEEVRSLGYFWEPLRAMEGAAVEPLPDLDDFLPRWRSLVASRAAGPRRNDWDTEEDRWLREAIRRIEGAEGLAKLARSTRRDDDLRAWCECVVASGDSMAALAAFEEAARLLADGSRARGEFLDGAAKAARCLGRKDLPDRLEQAWRAAPTLLRLRRWLGSSTSRRILAGRVAEALQACTDGAARQRALLHVLSREYGDAAELLAKAPGLGWSSGEHPGHLLFPVFVRLLGGRMRLPSPETDSLIHRDGSAEHGAGDAPEVEQLLDLAGIDAIEDPAVRAGVLEAMKTAAEKRVAGVTGEKRRRHYGHAAGLVATCLACDDTSATARWVAALGSEYRRFPAFRAELDRAMGAP